VHSRNASHHEALLTSGRFKIPGRVVVTDRDGTRCRMNPYPRWLRDDGTSGTCLADGRADGEDAHIRSVAAVKRER
jgi:hypothetical protein